MENRAFEDEPNKSARHHHLHPHPHQQQQQQQHSHGHLAHFQLDYPLDMSDHCHHQQQQQSHFDYRGSDGQHGSDCHVYEDIVAPYGLALEPGGGFQRNLTLPLRRTSQSCESIEGISSSVRVTNRERTRGSIIDRLGRDDRNRDSDSSAERPTRRRRKKDCKHCKIKVQPRVSVDSDQLGPQAMASPQQQQQQQCVEQLGPVYGERGGPELRAIFGLPDVNLCRLGSGCLNAGVVYAIGCNGTDCNNSLVSGDGTTTTTTTTTTGSFDDKALITPPKAAARAGMKVNSIYAQEHWHTAKDPRIFLNDPKEQSSPFQRAYSAVSANSPSSENRANLRRSVRDEPAPHPARLRKHRHGWTLHFGRPLGATACTKSLVLLLIVVLALLGIGGIALYIVFEPEKLHVIQQYLRSSARNSTSGRNGTLGLGLEEVGYGTSLPGSTYVDTVQLLNASLAPAEGGDTPGRGDFNDDPDDEPVLVTAWTTPTGPTYTRGSSFAPDTTSTSSGRVSTAAATTAATTTSTTTTTTGSALLDAVLGTRERRRPCAECRGDEVCVARNADEEPHCRQPRDPADASGCAGLCDSAVQKCHKLDDGGYRCTEEHHCFSDEWTCLNIFCIPLEKRCDGQMNCYDHSDEYNCECNLETHFHCGNQTSCLPLSKKCDGHVDCFDATDEENCTTSHDLGRLCRDEFTCRNKQQCIKRSRFCDGYRDCKDGSDEPLGCQHRCNKHEFSCRNGRCINKGDKCNGIDDCGDESDEQHCRERP